MTQIHRNAVVPYAPTEMFSLVNDIEAYPAFMPWCTSTRVMHRDDEEIRAEIHLAKRGIETSFTTRNLLQPVHRIEMQLIDGPFRRMQGLWRFEPLDDNHSRVSLDMEFELSSRLLKMTIGPLFSHIANSLVDAFVQRAGQVYGRR